MRSIERILAIEVHHEHRGSRRPRAVAQAEKSISTSMYRVGLAFNLQTAQALELNIPEAMLDRADKIFE